ncbi:MAG: transglutaminase domain-containing protein [Actinobacteria bacterium]|nr:transglutaminase domain-containing protein [Actinomycetota bacterium]
MNPDTRATLAAGTATVLAISPLGALFSTIGWLAPALGAVAAVTGAHLLARMVRTPPLLVPSVGAVGLLAFLTWTFAGAGSVGGVLPTAQTLRLLTAGLRAAGADLGSYAAPAPATPGLVLLATAIVGWVALSMDAIAVTMRRPAACGLVILLLYAVPTAILAGAVPWPYFALGGTGFLLLLAVDEHERLLRWSRPVSATDPSCFGDPTPFRFRGRRTGAVALAAAVLFPVIVPGLSYHGLASLRAGGGSSGGAGATLEPFSLLRGMLLRGGTPVEMMRLSSDVGSVSYLRTLVLDQYTRAGWQMSQPVANQAATMPLFGAGSRGGPTLDVHVTVTGFADHYLPTLAGTVAIDGLPPRDRWQYDRDREMIFSAAATTAGKSYDLIAMPPNPTADQLLASAQLPADAAVRQEWGAVPPDFSPAVAAQVRLLTSGRTAPYQRARAIYDYFAPSNGFEYSTATKDGNTGDDLANFLQQKQGYCQQYAAAMAIMLRVAGVPARVVIGFTHHGVPANGYWSILNTDAHAWAEAYFTGIGWIPFDPTPPDPTTPGRSLGQPWAPASTPRVSVAPTPGSTSSRPAGQSQPTKQRDNAADPAVSVTARHGITPTQVGTGLAIMLVLFAVATPGLVRTAQRRRRLATATRGDPAAAARAAWDEFTATAADLGLVLRPAESPRATAARLVDEVPLHGPQAAGMRLLAMAEERCRYAPDARVDGDLPTAVRAVRRGLLAARGRRHRLRARAAPSVLHTARDAVDRRLGELPAQLASLSGRAGRAGRTGRRSRHARG